jgi:hypothetical protein
MRADRVPVRARPAPGNLPGPKVQPEESPMQIPKDKILELLRSRGENDKASQAEGELPDQVDTEKDAGLLGKLGIDPQDIIGGLGGGGGIGGKLGL